MPKYDYLCDKCNEATEVVKSMSDPHPEVCECGGKLKQIYSAVGVTFKGSGFYKTDSRGK